MEKNDIGVDIKAVYDNVALVCYNDSGILGDFTIEYPLSVPVECRKRVRIITDLPIIKVLNGMGLQLNVAYEEIGDDQ